VQFAILIPVISWGIQQPGGMKNYLLSEQGRKRLLAPKVIEEPAANPKND
jgi:hypothetical protein